MAEATIGELDDHNNGEEEEKAEKKDLPTESTGTHSQIVVTKIKSTGKI